MSNEESDLEKRLREILSSHTKWAYCETEGQHSNPGDSPEPKEIYPEKHEDELTEKEAITEILTAIKDAGYRRNLADGLSLWSKTTELHRAGWMAGPEWYARLVKECEALKHLHPAVQEAYETGGLKAVGRLLDQELMNAAKRASGVE